MEAGAVTDSADDLSQLSDEVDAAQSNVKVKTKKSGVFGKLKGIFGTKKRRTRSHDSNSGVDLKVQVTTSEDVKNHQRSQSSTIPVNPMSMSVDSVFSPEDLYLPKTGIVEMKNTSASMEALVSNSKIKSELERKLINRRSLDDDGLPGSPIGTPTTQDILNHPNFLSQDSYRIDRDSDGSLLSMGSSDNDEDFFNRPWKGASTAAIYRPRRTVSSDSESDDTLDFDAVAQTESLSNAAAMHKRNVRPKNRAKTRRVSAAPGQMPSLKEKKTLEIAHTFLDEGKATTSIKLRNLDHANPSPVTVRRTESEKTYSPAEQRRSDSTIICGDSKSPKAVTRSATTIVRKQSDEEQKARNSELLSVFQRIKPPPPPQSPPPTEGLSESPPREPLYPELSSSPQQTSTTTDNSGDNVAPPRPAKTVGFSSTPPLQRRSKPPAVQPRPKSMFPQHERSKTLEVEGSKVDEALHNLSYSKSFNDSQASQARNTNEDSAVLRTKKSSEEDNTKAAPDWVKLAQRKTWAVTDQEHEHARPHSEPVTSAPKTASKPLPVPAPRVTQTKPDTQEAKTSQRPTSIFNRPDTTAMNNTVDELGSRLSQVKAKSESLPRDSRPSDIARKNTPSPNSSNAQDNRPLLYSSVGQLPPTRNDKGPVVTRRKSPYDNVMTESFGGFYGDRKTSPVEEVRNSKETIVLTRAKPSLPVSTPEESKENHLPVNNDPPWKANLKQRTGSLKATPTATGESGTPAPPPKPSWKSQTMKDRAPPSILSSSTEALDDILAAKSKSKSSEISNRRPNPMTMSETTAAAQEDGEETISVRDRLKMFQRK